ncbi:unnamed protein product [Chondrus crispus]|uniref:Uncharacterized protein n=1 Tax=Chondrus crispus TaxID=2769 RepID=R7QLQ1_CHOCR|nr:unnamed protein product [Chondrus crispus]CDF38994.1 unnamed protein product [Chondrus crispus]|eukprot:XP_005718899.1 unnamed protein product [Chondrus crispus]
MKFSLAICLLACLVAVVAAVPAQPRLPKLGEVSRQFDPECPGNYPPGLEFCCYPWEENNPFCEFNRL